MSNNFYTTHSSSLNCVCSNLPSFFTPLLNYQLYFTREHTIIAGKISGREEIYSKRLCANNYVSLEVLLEGPLRILNLKLRFGQTFLQLLKL